MIVLIAWVIAQMLLLGIDQTLTPSKFVNGGEKSRVLRYSMELRHHSWRSTYILTLLYVMTLLQSPNSSLVSHFSIKEFVTADP